MIKLYKLKEELWGKRETVYDNLFFADIEEDKVYDLEKTPSFLGDQLVDSGFTVDDNFDIEDVEEVEITDYYKVKYVVDEKDTYSIKYQIDSEGGKWDEIEKVWTVPGSSANFKTKIYYTKK